jgi:hypothetical protein
MIPILIVRLRFIDDHLGTFRADADVEIGTPARASRRST